MKKYQFLTAILATSVIFNFSACKKSEPVTETQPNETAAEQENMDNSTQKEIALDQLDRDTFNKAAVRLNLPIFWVYEETQNNTVRPEILIPLNFYPTSESFVWKDESGNFTKDFYDAYQKMVDIMKDPLRGAKPDDADSARLIKVADELDQGAATVVASDFRTADESEQNFIKAMLKASKAIDELYIKQIGLDKALSMIPEEDVMSRSMARRNWGVDAQSPKMKTDKTCRAIAGTDKIPVGVYPESTQKEDNFCDKLAERPDAETLLTPFTVVIEGPRGLEAVPYNVFFKDDMKRVSDALKEAVQALSSNDKELALIKYLNAAAESFLTNDWEPANEAWAAMNSTNSAWYVRCAPDETYWEPCSRKAGFHLTFARINADAIQWQEKLTPLQQEMEENLAKIAGKPYEARKVAFHLPDFIDIVTNSGDDRDPFGATVGQSLPNWGPVANEGRGRTMAMSNLYTDPDSLRDRRTLASSLFTQPDLDMLAAGSVPGLLGTILHEASHNLGPAHEYQVNGKIDDAIFGGSLATLAEEFKAQTASLWFIQYLTEKNVISPELAKQSYTDSVYWIFGQLSRGLVDSEGHIQPYSQLSAIQLGMMMEDGAVTYEPETMTANGKDKGAFIIHYEKMPESVNRIMTNIALIKAKGDKEALIKLQKQYVEGTAIPFDTIRERMLRLPKTSFVYSVLVK